MEQLLLDPAYAQTRVEFGMAEAEVAQRAQWRASAESFRAIEATLREAAEHAEVFIGFSRLSERDAVEFAVRAAASDLAVRLNLAESTVRSHAHIAHTLRERMPLLWAWFREGEVSTQNARQAATVVADLPAECWVTFDEQLVEPARTLAPARFEAKARGLGDSIQPIPLEQRHERARRDRRVWSELASDGMGWLSAKLPSDKIALATARIDGIAFGLLGAEDENRTMQQLRADVFADLLVGSADDPSAARVTVALTIPVLSILGESDQPATLEGVGPIPLSTARELCEGVPSLTRLLTDPIRGTILEVDARQYRPSASLKRWLRLRDVTCTFPGCGRRAVTCDLDHVVAWADGGVTSAENLGHLCRKHHRMKHETKWKVERPDHLGATGAPVWTSPTGYSRTADPPPY